MCHMLCIVDIFVLFVSAPLTDKRYHLSSRFRTVHLFAALPKLHEFNTQHMPFNCQLLIGYSYFSSTIAL